MPSSSLLENIKNLTDEPSQVLAIFSKDTSEAIYKEIRHVAKGLNLNNLNMPKDLCDLISLENYIPKC